MADVGVRDYLGQLVGAENVGYDEKTKGVTAAIGGKTYNLGNAGMTLGEDGKYYAQNGDYLKNLLINTTGYKPVRNTVQAQGGSVGWANNQPIINGQSYNTDGMINAGGTLYADPNFLGKLNTQNTFTNPYQEKQENIFDKLYSSKFNYNPNTDKGLQAAQKQAQNSVTRDAARRGILNSTDATYYSGLAASSLVPQYEQMAYSRYQDENQRLTNLSSMLSNMSTQQLGEWQANNTQRYNNTMMTLQQEQQAQQEQQNAIENAYKKVEMVGYADNETAVLLGVAPGTPATSVRQNTLDKITQIEINKANTDEQIRTMTADYNLQSTVGMDIYRQKSDIDLEASKDLSTFQTDEQIRQYNATTGVRKSGKKGGSGSGGGGSNSNDPVASALQKYATNNGLGTYLNMSADEIASVINSVVADDATKQQYYAQYGITPSPSETTDNGKYVLPYTPGKPTLIPNNPLLKNTYADEATRQQYYAQYNITPSSSGSTATTATPAATLPYTPGQTTLIPNNPLLKGTYADTLK